MRKEKCSFTKLKRKNKDTNKDACGGGIGQLTGLGGSNLKHLRVAREIRTCAALPIALQVICAIRLKRNN